MSELNVRCCHGRSTAQCDGTCTDAAPCTPPKNICESHDGRTRVLTYEDTRGRQVMVEEWPDGDITVSTRPSLYYSWGAPLKRVREEFPS